MYYATKNISRKDRALLRTCNYIAFGRLQYIDAKTLTENRRNAANLTAHDRRWVKHAATRKAAFSMIKQWVGDAA